MSKTNRSAYKELCTLMPGGVSSPVRACQIMNGDPLVIASGSGALLKDVEGKEYIDYCGGWGALIHGHAHPEIVQATSEQLAKGMLFGMTTVLEGELAKLISEAMPQLDLIRFACSGTEATMTAIRLARGFTGRKTVIKFEGNYHGHADTLVASRGDHKGLPPDPYLIELPYNDLDALKRKATASDIAALIVEPVAGNMGVVLPNKGFLTGMREIASEIGAVLIFDEVITGFRLAHGGAQSYFGIESDLTCLGKIVGGGFPLSVLGGKRTLMERLAPIGPIYHAGTFAGHPVSVRGGIEALRLLKKENFYTSLNRKSDLLIEGLEKKAEQVGISLQIGKCESMLTPFFGLNKVPVNWKEIATADCPRYVRLFHFLMTKGIFIPPSPHEAWFVSAAHSDEQLHYTNACFKEFLEYEQNR